MKKVVEIEPERAGGNKMTSKCHFMTTGEVFLISEKRQRNEANLENKLRAKFILRIPVACSNKTKARYQ